MGRTFRRLGAPIPASWSGADNRRPVGLIVLWLAPNRSRKMNSRFERFWYAIEHPLGPSRELGSYANHRESVEKLIREMNARVLPINRGLEHSPTGQPIRPAR